MPRASQKRRSYSPKRAQPEVAKRGQGAAAFAALVATPLRDKSTSKVSKAKAGKNAEQLPQVFSSEAIEAAREADIRHRRARRNAKSRNGRLFFS